MTGDGAIPVAVWHRLLPMHLHLDPAGAILSSGSTLRKLIGDAGRFLDAFQPVAPDASGAGQVAALLAQDRLFLRLKAAPDQVLRGRAAALPDGGAMLNLGFGIALPEAVRRFSLTDRDFPPSDLAMELLFLHEANGAMMAELARYNLRMEEARLAAEAQAFTDPLTGLYNRRALATALDHAALAARGPAGRPFALMHLDLDLFKAINDDHGHAAGDHVLRVVAERMSAATRADDTVARTGGDEFLLLLPGLADEGGLLHLGRRIIERIEAPIVFGNATCRVSASAGVAISTRYPQPEPDIMQHDADAALYRAKGEGRGCVRVAARPLSPAPRR